MKSCIVHSALAIVLIRSLSPAVAEDAPTPVGAWGAHQRLAVRGAITFDPEQIVSELASDLDVLVAAHPSAPLDDYLEVLQRRLVDGYRHAGFPDATAMAEVERITDRIVLTVDEGKRLVAEEVHVEGARHIDAAVLASQLTKPQRGPGAVALAFENRDGHNATAWVNSKGEPVDAVEPIFKRGKPVPLDELTQDELRKQIRQVLEDSGHYRVRFGFRIEASTTTHRASDLWITIKDEGPPAIVDDIVVEGLQRDTQPALLDYLDLKPGTAWTLDQRMQIEQRLWNSARYWEKAPG